jgi:uroporphyrinogen-III synthase
VQKIPLLLTRPVGTNEAFVRGLPAALRSRLDLIDCPLLRIVSLESQVAMGGSVAAIFTSSNGVRFAPPPLGRRAYCVGARTTETAQAAGWRAICAGQTAAELVDTLLQARPAEKLVHLAGKHVRGEVVEQLVGAGLEARRVALYDQQLEPLSQAARGVLDGKSPVLVPLFSPRAAAHFANVAPLRDGVTVVTMSVAVTEALGDAGEYTVIEAAEPTAEAMVAALEKHVLSNSLG